MQSLLSADVLSAVVAYALTLLVLRLAVTALAGLGAVPTYEPDGDLDTPLGATDDIVDRRVRRRSLSFLALIVPILGLFWMVLGVSPLPPWLDLYAECLSDLAYVLGVAVLFPRIDIIGLTTRRAKMWTGTAAMVLGVVLVYVPRF